MPATVRGVAALRLPSIAIDFWQLRDGEQMHREHPATFWIPDEAQRRNLRPGQAAKLIFDIEAYDEDGSVIVQGERMWVLVTERIDDQYIGLLTNKPGIDGDFYLQAAAEVPFGPEHVIDIDEPPEEFVRIMLSEPPTRSWPRPN